MFAKSELFYDAMYIVGFALMMIINLKTHDRYHIKKKDAIFYTLYTYVCGIVGALIMGIVYTYVYRILGFEAYGKVAIFGAVIFTPFLILLFPIKHKDWKHIMDMLTPGILLILTCAKLGCFVNGCCVGIVCDFGVHYLNDPNIHFPVQAFEVLTMLLILCITQLYFCKSKHFVSGTAYPITFAIYSVTRFVWEFFRYYEDDGMRHILFGLDFWQLICIAVFLVCVFIIILETRKSFKARVKSNDC